MWDEIQANARAGVFPKDTDVFLYKYSGLFYVAPAQNSFMCRLRIPGRRDARRGSSAASPTSPDGSAADTPT